MEEIRLYVLTYINENEKGYSMSLAKKVWIYLLYKCDNR